MTPQRVLMTGHRGYVGSVMAPVFRDAGHDVVGLDVDYYRGCDLMEPPDISTIVRDVRDVEAADLRGFDAVVHLAALSNDPVGDLNPGWTESINHTAARRTAAAASEAGVRRFLFASSCIMYGLSGGGEVDETSRLNPQTDYARSKVLAEQAISDLASDTFSPVHLRNGTIYGVSPRMRFDTVLNNLAGWATTTGKITVLSDGTPWRPVVHVQDVARAFLAVLEAPVEIIHNQAFNIGSDELNYQVRDLARAVQRAVPGSTLEILASEDADQRTYRTSFTKFAHAFPTFRFERDANAGAAELASTLDDLGLTHEEFVGDKFTRLKRLARLLADGQLDGDLRWRVAEGVSA
jgi:nucleoside-diphosphate-sugar epimerase